MLHSIPRGNNKPLEQPIVENSDRCHRHVSSPIDSEVAWVASQPRNHRHEDFDLNRLAVPLGARTQMKQPRMGMAEKNEATELPSSPLPPQRGPERVHNRGSVHAQQHHFSGNIFSLDPSVGVAVNLAIHPSTNNYGRSLHRSSCQQHTAGLPAVPEKASLLRSSSRGEITACLPPMRHQVSADMSSTNTSFALAETEMPSSGCDIEVETFSLQECKNTHSMYKQSAVEPNQPHPSLEFPPLYFVIKRWPWLVEVIRSLYLYRWRASYPLQKRVPCSQVLRRFGVFLTWGELFLILPFFALIVIGTLWSFVYPSPSVTGHVARLPLILCFVTAMHNSFLSLLLGMPFLKALWYHKLAGRVALINGVLHTYVCYFYPSDNPSFDAPPSGIYAHVRFGPYLVYDRENFSGTAILALVTGIAITSLPLIRRKLFELFYFIHVVFAASMAACAFYHSGKLVPILVSITWGIDLIIRKLIMAVARYPRKAQTRVISSTVVELRFPKTSGFDFNPGQYVYLCVPELSLLEWHPFSISSSPGQKIVTFHIRTAGTWTSALHALAQTRDEVSIFLEGPYGNCDVDLMSNRYKTVFLLSGGIGITPMQSICNQLIYEHSTMRRMLKRLSFVWIERDPIIMSDVDIVRRSSTLHLNAGDNFDASTVISAIHEGAPLGIASTILALVPPVATTDAELDKVYPESCIESDELHEDFSVVSIPCNPEEMCAMSQLSDEGSLFRQGFENYERRAQDDDTFLGAAYNRASMAPTDVLDMQVYLTSRASSPGLSDLPFVYHGRPDINRLFLKMREGALASGESRIAVCVCAPSRIVDLCQKACVKFSDSRIRFDLHTDNFV